MTAEDLPAVLVIEQESHLEPWPRESFLEELERLQSYLFVAQLVEETPPDRHPEPGSSKDPENLKGSAGKRSRVLPFPSLGRGAASPVRQPTPFPPGASLPSSPGIGPIAGYVCFWCVVDELQIFNIAVHPAFRRHHIGRELMLHALSFARERKLRQAVLEVRRSNLPARRLYESLGFRVVGERPNYYGVLREPAILMRLGLDGPHTS